MKVDSLKVRNVCSNLTAIVVALGLALALVSYAIELHSRWLKPSDSEHCDNMGVKRMN
jgi:hypothetical protein